MAKKVSNPIPLSMIDTPSDPTKTYGIKDGEYFEISVTVTDLTIDEIITGLEAKSGEERLDASAIKNLPTGSTTFYGLADTPANSGGIVGYAFRAASGAVESYDQSVIQIGNTVTNDSEMPLTVYGVAVASPKNGLLITGENILLGGVNGGSAPYRELMIINASSTPTPILHEYLDDADENRFNVSANTFIPAKSFAIFVKISNRWVNKELFRLESLESAVNDLEIGLPLKASLSSTMGAIVHLGDNNVARTDHVQVTWTGWVEPLNATEHDRWDEIPAP